MRYYVQTFICGNWQTEDVFTSRVMALGVAWSIQNNGLHHYLNPRVVIRKAGKFVEVC